MNKYITNIKLNKNNMSDYNDELYAEMCHDNGVQYDNNNIADEMLLELFEFA